MSTRYEERTHWLHEVWGLRTQRPNSGSSADNSKDKDDGNGNINNDDTTQRLDDLKRTDGRWNALGSINSISSTALDAFDYAQIASSSKNARRPYIPHDHLQNDSAPVPLINRSDWVVVGTVNTVEFDKDMVESSNKASGSTSRNESSSNTGIRKECVICCDTDAVFASTPPTDKCLHQPQSCVSCLGKTIEVAVKSDSKTDDIKCPNCPEFLDYEAVVKWADPATFERYNELLLLKVLKKEEGYVDCLNPACGSGQVHHGDTIFPIVICHKCKAKSCYRHRVEWHEGFTCKEWDNKDKRWKRENELSDEWIHGQTKRCPADGCGRPIQKTEGCDHMTCRLPGGCGHQFCWACLAPYGPISDQGCHMHKEDCPYWVRNFANMPAIPPPEAMIAAPAPNVQSHRHRWMFWRREHTSQTQAVII